MKVIVLILLTILNFSTFAFSFGSLFHTHTHKRKKVVSTEPTYVDAKGDFAKYCTKKDTTYGIQIRCSKVDEPKNFKFDASAVAKCKQKARGISNVFPGRVDIPAGFIKQLDICPQPKIYGPNILHKVNVAESGVIGIEHNQTETFYDVVCHNAQNYKADMYKEEQAKYDREMAFKSVGCEHAEVAVVDSSRYILIFKILVGLAIVSFILRFYFKYKNPK